MLVKGMSSASEGVSSGLAAQAALAAQAYAWFAGILAGFAFAGLALYLSRNSGSSGKPNSPIATQVAVTLFYSMSSLTICTFLYISLIGNPNHYRVFLAGLIYGPALGLSVLSLFYSMLLMILEHDVIKGAAQHAHLVVVIAGPTLVIYFLAYHFYWALQARCDQPDASTFLCRTDGPLWSGGILILILGLASGIIMSAIVSMFYGIDKKVIPMSIFREKSFIKTEIEIALPSSLVFILVAITAILSWLIPTRGNVAAIPDWAVWLTLGGGSLFLTIFSIFVWQCHKQVKTKISNLPPPAQEPQTISK